MYSTCLFCNGELGKNQVIEHFPVGRRLAFDGAKGRLWVVCRKCERWNLTPLEERWEAIEECEGLFRATRLRVSTDHIGLARLKDGLELVRIGEPQRPEMAAWRYGDQFGRRRRRYYRHGRRGRGGVRPTVMVAGPMMGLIGAGAINPVWQLYNADSSLYKARKMIHLSTEADPRLRVRLSELPKTKLYADRDGVVLRVTAVRDGPLPSFWTFDSRKREVSLTGDEAIRAAGALLPRLNHGGGSRDDVKRAVQVLEDAGDPMRLFRRAANLIEKKDGNRLFAGASNINNLKSLDTSTRLALEMAAHGIRTACTGESCTSSRTRGVPPRRLPASPTICSCLRPSTRISSV